MVRLLFILLLLFPIDSSSDNYFHAYQNYWLMPKEAFNDYDSNEDGKLSYRELVEYVWFELENAVDAENVRRNMAASIANDFLKLFNRQPPHGYITRKEAKMISWSKVDYIFAKALHRVDHPISNQDELQIENIDDSIEITKEHSSSSETSGDDDQSTSFEVYND